MRIESNGVLAKSIFSSQILTARMVRAPASRAVGREFYPGLCSYSAFVIICNASLLQVRPMVTSRLALTCCKLVSHLHTCSGRFAVQVCCKLKLLSGLIPGLRNASNFTIFGIRFLY
ncbi:hypothetical protein AVEN_161400-1 [Araneus ventricosus]|uniref:Uncharacterized protein n=1 Tax=Araneus ventricosus TaxID=182803 RepID=A0A4Y2FN25_ARAVE|nr:hypothetical protein AVEN_161400-1 [Araneus ventricosus]